MAGAVSPLFWEWRLQAQLSNLCVDDLFVLAMSRASARRGLRLPNQDWSLRVTQVYRRQGGQWWLVHRHADPLVRHVGLETAAALARGAHLDRR